MKTSGVTFDRNSGLVTTAQRVDFSMAQGQGSAMGASYDSQSGYLTLDQAVELTTHRGADEVEIHAQHAEFDRGAQTCRWMNATTEYHGGQADAAEAKILFRDDGSAERLDAKGGFTLATAKRRALAAPVASMDFDEHNQPLHGHMEGGVTMDSATRMGRTVHGTSPTAELEFARQGRVEARAPGARRGDEERGDERGGRGASRGRWHAAREPDLALAGGGYRLSGGKGPGKRIRRQRTVGSGDDARHGRRDDYEREPARQRCGNASEDELPTR